MRPGTVKALSWPIRFLLALGAKSINCVGFSLYLAQSTMGQGSPITWALTGFFAVLFFGYCYADTDKRLLNTKSQNSAPSASIKNLLIPTLLLAFCFSVVRSNYGLLEVNHIESASMSMYLFLVLFVLNGPLLCITMETICSAESYVFSNKASSIVYGVFFLIGITALSVGSQEKWQFIVMISTAMIILLASIIQTVSSIRNVRKAAIVSHA